MIAMNTPRFKLGQILATPGAMDALDQAGQSCWEFVSQHSSGIWGALSDDDKALNEQALKDGSRILSAYFLKDGQTKIWVITEAEDDHGHRAATTLLLPDEY